MTELQVGDEVLARSVVEDIIDPDGMEPGGVLLRFEGGDSAFVDFEGVQVIEEPKPKTPVTGARAWIAKVLVMLALKIAFGPNHGRDLTLTFNEEV